jgi:cytochrome c biogenesis protein CcmG/thiol:disulfide interchange protein DsbE
VVLGVTLALLVLFACAGWANWKWKQQRSAQLLSNTAKGTMTPDAASGSSHAGSPLVGKPAPAFVLEDVDGHKVRLESLRGKAVLLNFWATWCGPCRIETPWLVELRNKYASQGVEVVGISTEGEDLKPDDKIGLARQRNAVKRFVAEMKVPYPMLLGGDALSEQYGGLDSMPTSYYLDKKGVVVAVQLGISSEAEIEANLQKALGAGE